MLLSYIKIALRNLTKNRLYAAINVLGLAIGLTVFLLSLILTAYELNHDQMFSQRDRIYTVGAQFFRSAEIGVLETDSVQSAVGPIIESSIPELDATARIILREFLVTRGEDSYYQKIRFADPTLTQIFDFDYLYGDGSVLADPSALILTESAAKKFFGRIDVVGNSLELDHSHSMHVAAVIRDISLDSHFSSSPIEDTSLEIIAPFVALKTIDDYPLEGEWNNISFGNLTYLLLPSQFDQQWLQSRIDPIYNEHVNAERKEFIQGFKVRPLAKINTLLWDSIGFPMIDSVRLLGLLVLIIACVNYTNLATAQSFGRTREVGLRKTFGAGRNQLLVQFLTESLTITVLALLLALAVLEILIPWYNQASTKAVNLDYLGLLPGLVLTALAVGLLAGAYPAYLITRVQPIDSLKNSVNLSGGRSWFRSLMIGLQFAISTFMLALVLVMLFQNRTTEQASHIYPKDNVVILERLSVEDIQQNHETLRNELLAIDGVRSVSYSSQVPFEQSNNSWTVAPKRGDEALQMSINKVAIDRHFLATYDIELVAGRNFSPEQANDRLSESSEQVNVIINQLAAQRLGFGSADKALGKKLFNIIAEPDENDQLLEMTVVGVMPDQNFLGLHNKIKPMMFFIQPADHRTASLRISDADLRQVLQSVDQVWDQVIPAYPIQRRFLDDVFQEVFDLMRTMTGVISVFAVIALTLALIGLFGLAAFMAEQRTKEIGIRKVLGAKVGQIASLLVWQFSIPVMWSLLLALPLAYLATGLYLDFFADRVTYVIPILIGACAVAILLAWLIVAVHALRIAARAPIRSLRYE